MSLVIEVPDELIALLRKNAAAQGKDVNSYAVAALSKAAQQDAIVNSPHSIGSGKLMTQFVNEQREKHGFPADWGTGKSAPLTDEEQTEIDSAFAEIYPDAAPTSVK